MNEGIWIYTTTLPSGEFDIFHFWEVLQTASTLELKETLMECNEMELLHTRCFMRSEGDTADHKAKARFFGKVAQHIAHAIERRKHTIEGVFFN